MKKCMECTAEGRRPVGRPRRTWLISVEANMAELEIDRKDTHDKMMPDLTFMGKPAMRTRWMAPTAPHKAGDVETNPGPTSKSEFAMSATHKYKLGRIYRYGATGLNTRCTSDVHVSD